jgi:hypothetical protein
VLPGDRGLELLDQLVREPDREVHVLDLAQAIDGGDPGEVQSWLSEAIRRIADEDAELGSHLDWAVQRGTFCVYRSQ